MIPCGPEKLVSPPTYTRNVPRYHLSFSKHASEDTGVSSHEYHTTCYSHHIQRPLSTQS